MIHTIAIPRRLGEAVQAEVKAGCFGYMDPQTDGLWRPVLDDSGKVPSSCPVGDGTSILKLLAPSPATSTTGMPAAATSSGNRTALYALAALALVIFSTGGGTR